MCSRCDFEKRARYALSANIKHGREDLASASDGVPFTKSSLPWAVLYQIFKKQFHNLYRLV
jgi:hypothetical protein